MDSYYQTVTNTGWSEGTHLARCPAQELAFFTVTLKARKCIFFMFLLNIFQISQLVLVDTVKSPCCIIQHFYPRYWILIVCQKLTAVYKGVLKIFVKRLLVYSCPSILPTVYLSISFARKNWVSTARIVMKFDIWEFFESLFENFKVH